MSHHLLLLGLLFCSLPLTAAAQAPVTAPAPTTTPSSTTVIRGRILEADSQNPVGWADVKLIGPNLHATTDADGRFVFRGVAPGTYVLHVTRMGYQEILREGVQVESVAEMSLELPMTPKFEHPMAVVILGGLVTSTLLNLFVVPSLYLRFGASNPQANTLASS